MGNKSEKQFFSTTGINWDDDASIEEFARKVWANMNTQRQNTQREENNMVDKADEPSVKLTGKYVRAVEYANLHHANQTRKGKDITYMSHLLAVSALVLEAGGDEDQAIGALLHDVAEDCGGEARLVEIRELFGSRVEAIVRGCSDSVTENPEVKAPWLERKQEYLEHLAHAPADVLIVSTADKLHNSRDTLLDMRRLGIDTLERFNGGGEGTVAYYTSLWIVLNAAGERAPSFLVDQLGSVAQEMVDTLYPGRGLEISRMPDQKVIAGMLLLNL
jgi:(p)ppGpp synthase/HD superfamily hydrolase